MLSLTPFKIITVSRPSTLLRVFLVVRLGCPTKGGNWGVSMQAQKFELSPSVDDIPTKNLSSPVSPMITDHILEKKTSLIAFRQILPKILSVAFTFSYTIMTNLKNLIETKSFNTKQCPAGLPLNIIPHYFPKHSWESLGMRENPSQQQKN